MYIEILNHCDLVYMKNKWILIKSTKWLFFYHGRCEYSGICVRVMSFITCYLSYSYLLQTQRFMSSLWMCIEILIALICSLSFIEFCHMLAYFLLCHHGVDIIPQLLLTKIMLSCTPWKAGGSGSSAWIPATHVGQLDRAAGSWFQLGTALAFASIKSMN